MRIAPPRIWRERGARYRLEGCRCTRCGRMWYPPKPLCPYCGSKDIVKINLPQQGRLISWTIEYTVPAGYRGKAPIIIGLVELDNGVKVLAEITDVKPEELVYGMRVECVLRKLYEDGDEGVIVYGIKFVPQQQ